MTPRGTENGCGKARAGFTLVEMLAALLVVTLLTGVVATGVATGVRAYKTEQFVSQAEMLSGALENALADPFRSMGEPNADQYRIAFDKHNVFFDKDSDPLRVEGGKLYVVGKDKGGKDLKLKVLNDGMYGTGDMCEIVSLEKKELTLADASGRPRVEYTYGIAGAGGFQYPADVATRPLKLLFIPLVGVTKNRSIDSSSDGGSDDGPGAGGEGEGSKLDEYRQALQAAIDAARQALDQSRPDPWPDNLRTAIAAAEALLAKDDAELTQDELVQQRDALDAKRIEYLNAGQESGLDYASLGALVKEASDALRDEPKDDRFTAELRSAYDPAASCVQNQNATTQDEIDAAASTLKDALAAYRKGVYTGALLQALSDANKLKTETPKEDESLWPAFTKARTDAQSVYDKAVKTPPAATQNEIDQAAKALQAAYDAYIKGKDKQQGGGDDNDAPTIGKLTDAQRKWSTVTANWDAFSWESRTDASGEAYLAAAESFGQVAMIYFDGEYYKCKEENGNDSTTPLQSSVEQSSWYSAFSVEQLDGKVHAYSYGNRWWQKLES